MEFNESEKATILRAIKIYQATINFFLKNRNSRRRNPEVVAMKDLYEQDLLNIDSIEIMLK